MDIKNLTIGQKIGIGAISVGVITVIISLLLQYTGSGAYWDDCTDDARSDAGWDACSEGDGEGGEDNWWLGVSLFWVGGAAAVIGGKILSATTGSDTTPLSPDESAPPSDE
jgi:hypothetical protein